ncbi:DUF3916 domain-containing protein, partial [Bacillus thuringiensis]|nr:DUF3916 domain-containing protein [Bacillus thuringiensis]
FNRNSEFQKWILLSNEIDFWEKLEIPVCHSFETLRFQEIIYDEDECYEKEILFIGELN